MLYFRNRTNHLVGKEYYYGVERVLGRRLNFFLLHYCLIVGIKSRKKEVSGFLSLNYLFNQGDYREARVRVIVEELEPNSRQAGSYQRVFPVLSQGSLQEAQKPGSSMSSAIPLAP